MKVLIEPTSHVEASPCDDLDFCLLKNLLLKSHSTLRHAHLLGILLPVAAAVGIEPTHMESKTIALPLGYAAI